MPGEQPQLRVTPISTRDRRARARALAVSACCILSACCFLAATAARGAANVGPRLTIYGQGFAVVQERRSVDLPRGEGTIRLEGIPALLDPASVMVRDAAGGDGVRVLDQLFAGEPWSEALLLKRSEGKTIRFASTNPATGEVTIRSGRVLRGGDPLAPVIEIDGAIQFGLPGRPLFDPPAGGALPAPSLSWNLWSDRAGRRDLEISYLTDGLRWEAFYNLVAPEGSDRFDLSAWVSLDNHSGRDFTEAAVNLMAGDINRVQPPAELRFRGANAMAMPAREADFAPQVSERAFDDYHLYTMERPLTLRDGETRQIELLRAAAVPAKRLYIYDGGAGGPRPYAGRSADMGGGSTRVDSILEFRNDRASGLDRPLPAGTMKVFRADRDGRRTLVGENRIDHTPAGETVRVRLGSAFDLVGERRQTRFDVDNERQRADEAFAIVLRNHKKEAVEIRVVERLQRWAGWSIAASSIPYTKLDARTVEFRVTLPPEGEATVTYQVHYTW